MELLVALAAFVALDLASYLFARDSRDLGRVDPDERLAKLGRI